MRFGKNKNRILKYLTVVLASIIVFTTTYALILPAITLDQDTAANEPGIEVPETQSEGQLLEDEDPTDIIMQDVPETERVINETESISDQDGDITEESDAETEPDTAGETETETETTAPATTGMPAVVFREETNKDHKDNVIVTVTAEEGTFPAGSFMTVRNVTDIDNKVETSVKDAVDKSDKADGEIKAMQVIDISFFNEDGQKIEPLKEIKVKFESESIKKIEEPVLVHIPDEGKGDAKVVEQISEQEAEQEGKKDSEIIFKADDFSMYVIVETESITVTYLTADGSTYEVTVTCDSEAGIPEGSELIVSELTEEDEDYDSYVSQTADKVNLAVSELSFIRLFDIKIVDEDGEKVTLGAPVDVQIRLLDKEEIEQSAQVVHFGDDIEIMDSTVEGDTVSFATTGFSAYAIVEGPPAITVGWNKVASLEELSSLGSAGLYIGHVDGYYFTSGITQITGSRTGITKTKPAQTSHPADGAVKYYFEQAGTAANQYKVYCLDGDTKKYIVQSSNSLNLTTTENNATVFTIQDGNGISRFKALGNNGYYWNMQAGANGASFAAYDNATDPNAMMYFWYRDPVPTDPYNLSGKTYGFMNWNGGVAGKALMAEGSLDAKALVVMSTADDSDQLFVPNESDIAMWTFHWVSDDKYQISTVVDGSTKYLRIAADGLSVVSEVDDDCNIQVIPGTGIHAGEISLKTDNATLTYSGTVEGGFSVNGAAGNEWLHLVEESELTDEYFLTYSAGKVSVSDAESVTNGSKVIVYTRSWNEEKKKYDLYAISSDGTLVPVFESGDSIEWVSGQINKLLWNFTEYYWEGTQDPNFYYELYNQYSEKFVAPQITDGQILADEAIGINLNGRRDGQYYSTILAWDDNSYSYVGLKVEDGHIVACPKSEAMDFYFAIMEDINVDDDLSTVQTVDHTQYGITMKIIDLENDPNHQGPMSQFLGSSAGGVGNVLHQGLLSSDLKGNGYPTAAGGSLGELYSGAREVNHLFIESTYHSSGYFMYDSTQNFASLNNGDNFTVYKEIASYDSGGNRPTLKHGQFFPFNDLKPGSFASANGKNLYDVFGNELVDDPRKNENLYSIEHDGQKADTYFAVELEAAFTQTPNGLDAWGHDIIFEFTGDDDFWLYVDGELVIDLGGIHSAVPGSVNFRTGEVNVNGTNTTLRDLFIKNYKNRGHSQAEAEEYVADKFVQNSDGQWVFADYTNHSMRIFYMERGGGASNLQMRFNLAAVKKGNVQLSKELVGVDPSEDVLAEFPYQIIYKTEDDTEHRLQNAIPHSSTQNTDYVYYKDTVHPVAYEPEITIAGNIYKDVFFLKPGETADISFPEGMESYRIVECGVNTEVYSSVTVNNGDETVNAETVSTNRKDYSIEFNTTDSRPKVNFENKVNPDALKTLTIEKWLFREDGAERIKYPTDQTTFDFRLYLATEYDELDVSNMHIYHVKDPDGVYCRWDPEQKKLVPLESGKTVFSELTPDEKEAASFTTSIYGSISKIPADHTVEIRNVLAGTKFRVVERPWEIPDGYSFQKYIYNGTDQTIPAETGIEDVVVSDTDPEIKICNIKGWGLRVNKVWTDSDYMAERASAYFAIYTKSGDNETLVDGSVRRLTFDESEQTVYWYFQTLPVTNVGFEDYVIREVILEGSISINEVGVVSGYTSITPLLEGGELKIQGRQKGESESSEFKYNVSYKQGAITEDSNVRVDTVTNDRPGIVLKKMQWNGTTPLAGAVFELKDNKDNLIGTFTSDDAGLITVAFLRDDVPYTLTETTAPHTWHGLQHPLTIVLDEGDVAVSGEDTGYYQVVRGDGVIPTLIVKDRPFELHAVKKDGDTNLPMAGVTFALHKQVSVGGVINIDVNPMPGYEALVTDANGLIPQIDNTLPAGIYEIREKQTPSGYEPIGYIQFKITETGDITFVNQPPTGVTLDKNEEGTAIQYVLTIPNHRLTDVTLKKVDNSSHPLKGSKFTLYKFESSWKSIEDIDMTNLTEKVLSNLEVGRYRLTETKSPDGYIILSKDIYFNIEPGDGGTIQVRLTDEAGTGDNSNENASLSGTVITVKNTPGEELPYTGGPGRTLYILGGSALLMASALIYGFRLRRRRKLYKDHRL